MTNIVNEQPTDIYLFSNGGGHKVTAEKIHAQIELCNALIHKGELKAAHDVINDAWSSFQSESSVYSDSLAMSLLFTLSQVNFKRQNLKGMEYYSELLLELSRSIEDGEKEVTALTNIAIARSVSSDYKTAIPMYVEALEKSKQLGFRSNAMNCLINIGTIYANLFNYEDALDRYQTVLEDYQDVLTDDNHIAINQNTGNLYHASEQYQSAIDYFQKAIDIAKKLGNTSALGRAYALLSRTYLAMGDLDLAIEHAHKSKNLMPDSEKVRQINLLNLAEIDFIHGHTAHATELAKLGIASARQVKDDASELRGFKLLANIFNKETKYRYALKCQMIYSKKQEDYLKMQRSMHLLDFEIRYALRDKQLKIEELTKENQFHAIVLERNSQIEKQNEQLRQANEELQQFAYITSHDLKEPLRMIGSYAQIVAQQFASNLDDDSRLYFKFINDGVTRMNALLDALLQYATIGKTELDLEVVDVADIVHIARGNLKLKIEETHANILCGEMPSVRAIPSFLIQLFQNLIGNAIKFRRPDSRPIVLINAEEKENEWVFYVKDNGIGIAPEHQDRIFVIFQRLHTRAQYEGTGIGLSICHKIVTQLGGKIRVESELGNGSSFIFTIPK